MPRSSAPPSDSAARLTRGKGHCKAPRLTGERRIPGPRPASGTEARPGSPLGTGVDTAARPEVADFVGSGATVRCMRDDDGLDSLVAAARELDPQPRARRWVSVSFCVLDAVHSIGAHYDRHVVPVVERVAADWGIDVPAVPMSEPDSDDPVPLDAFLDRYLSVEALLATTRNRQNTSTRGGIRKADATLRYAAILRDHEIRTIQDARALLADDRRLEAVETALRTVPGEGGAGVRRGYLWMLIGDHQTVKPDRMVLRWLAHHGATVTAETARTLLTDIARQLSAETGRPVSPWEVDHAIWRAARTRR